MDTFKLPKDTDEEKKHRSEMIKEKMPLTLSEIAQIAEKFVKKGTLVYIEGKIRTRSYDDQSGVKRYITEIIADNLELLSRKAGGEYEPNAPKAESAPQNSPQKDFDDASDVDDLPF